jgi:hypothetical protein
MLTITPRLTRSIDIRSSLQPECMEHRFS